MTTLATFQMGPNRKVTIGSGLALVALAVMLILHPWFEGAAVVGWAILIIAAVLDLFT